MKQVEQIYCYIRIEDQKMRIHYWDCHIQGWISVFYQNSEKQQGYSS